MTDDLGGTQRGQPLRRMGVISSIHTGSGEPQPGRAGPSRVRLLLSRVNVATDDLARRLDALAADMDARPGDQCLHLRLRLPAERAHRLRIVGHEQLSAN